MSYRLAVIGYAAYPQRIETIYRDDPTLAQASWAEQRDAVRDHPAMVNLPFTRDFRALGVEVAEFYPDVPQLDAAWARDHGVGDDWPVPPVQVRTARLLGQLADFAPDVLYVHGLLGLSPDFYAAVKEWAPSLRLVCGFEGLMVSRSRLRGVDLLFVCVPPFVEDARRLGVDAAVLYHGFDPDLLNRPEIKAADAAASIDFSFVGSSGYGGLNIHEERYWTLLALTARAGLRCRLNEPWRPEAGTPPDPAQVDRWIAATRAALGRRDPAAWADGRLLAGVRAAAAAFCDRPPAPLTAVFPDLCGPPAYGLEMLALLRRSRVVFNMHVGLAAGAVGNYRMFETAGVGACLLTDDGDNIKDLFEPDVEAVVYRSADEALEKARYLLEHEDERRRIAAAGQARALSQHSFAQRCARIDAAVRRRLRGAAAC